MKRLMKLKIVFLFLTALVLNTTVVTAGTNDMSAENYNKTISCSSSRFSMFIKDDGSLWACGSNEKGALGDGTTEEKPIPVKIMDDVISVSTSYYFGLAIKKDGSLWAWGNNEDGQLGDGTTVDKLKPVKILDDVMVVSAGSFYSAAVKKDGSLWIWGLNLNGELGDGTTTNRLRPIRILDDVLTVDVTGYFGFGGLAIKKDGSLWGWGASWGGYLGLGMDSGEVLLPTKLMDDVIDISISDVHCMVIKKDGSLWAWGDNTYGQIGDGWDLHSLQEGSGIRHFAYPVKIMDDVTRVSANNVGTMAIKKDGSLWSWGWLNRMNALRNDTITQSYTPIKIMEDVVDVSSESTHIMVVKKDGSLWTWGSNEHGALGDGTVTIYDGGTQIINNDRKEPVKIADNIMVRSSAKPVQESALPAFSRVMINDDIVSFDAYMINGYTYFKLRDLALALNGTSKHFEVSWDAINKAIQLSPGKPYTSIGGELLTGNKSNQKANPTTVDIYMDGKKIELAAYEINSNNYFKLRDIGKLFDFEVEWESKSNTIKIDTSKAYKME